jgi:arginase family enzyme
LHLNLDDAWSGLPPDLPVLDAREWGPRLRFSAPARLIEEFYREYETRIAPFLVYGSGDFHHLSALWLRRLREPFVLVSFDNHPDWDLRPPRWGCGGWVNRALELPLVQKIAVWGCGNFECWWPRQIFGNRRAEREGRLEVYPWADDRPASDQQRRGAILRANWRERFAQFARELTGANVYVTIDLDCLRAEDAVTNWESGRFTLDDVVWALNELHEHTKIVAGDICGAWSPPKYARRKQRFAAEMDHPKLPPRDSQEALRINLRAFETLWPLLGGSSAPPLDAE